MEEREKKTCGLRGCTRWEGQGGVSDATFWKGVRGFRRFGFGDDVRLVPYSVEVWELEGMGWMEPEWEVCLR